MFHGDQHDAAVVAPVALLDARTRVFRAAALGGLRIVSSALARRKSYRREAAKRQGEKREF